MRRSRLRWVTACWVSAAVPAALLLAGGCSGTGDLFIDAGRDATAGDAGNGVDVLFLPETGVLKDGGGGGDGAPNPDLGCLTDDAGCVNCCFDNHPDGSSTYFDTLIACACTTGATCHSVSACYNSLCKGNAPTVSCDTCLSNPDAGDCYAKADQACTADPDCVAFFECATVVCAGPPPDDAGAD